MASQEMPAVLHPSTVRVLPESDNRGEVVEVPNGTGMVVGDVILFGDTPLVEVEIDSVVYRLVHECDIFGWYTRVDRSAPAPI